MGSSASSRPGFITMLRADGDALALAAGELVRQVVGAVPDAEALEHAVDHARGARAARTPASISGNSMFSRAVSRGTR